MNRLGFLAMMIATAATACSSSTSSGSTANPDGGGGTPGAQVVSISESGDNLCAIVAGGAVYCYGDNSYGELGDGSMDPSQTAVAVSGLTSGVTQVAAGAGNGSVCAVTAAGGAVCWGDDSHGGLGNGTNDQTSLTPVPVTGLASGVSALSVSNATACALLTSGAVMCWGNNQNGQLGNGTTTDSNVPVQVTGLTSGAIAISVGGPDACALMKSGSVMCWGDNSSGQLGNGTTTDSAVPVAVTGLTSATAISAMSGVACAIQGGAALCWGGNSNGNLGNGSTDDASVPTPVMGLTSGVTSIGAGASTSCALVNGGVMCWGQNGSYGQLGNGSTTDSSVPVPVTGLTSGVKALSNGDGTSCAIAANGDVDCWGEETASPNGSSGVPYPTPGF